jgi:hypothetical protein
MHGQAHRICLPSGAGFNALAKLLLQIRRSTIRAPWLLKASAVR